MCVRLCVCYTLYTFTCYSWLVIDKGSHFHMMWRVMMKEVIVTVHAYHLSFSKERELASSSNEERERERERGR